MRCSGSFNPANVQKKMVYPSWFALHCTALSTPGKRIRMKNVPVEGETIDAAHCAFP